MRTAPTARYQPPDHARPARPATWTRYSLYAMSSPWSDGARPPRDPRGGLLGRVLRLSLLAADARHGVVRRQRRLREADRDERDLAVEARHVAGGVHAGQVRLAALVHPYLALVRELEAPVGD